MRARVCVYIYMVFIIIIITIRFGRPRRRRPSMRSEIGVMVASLGGLGNNIDTLLSVRIYILKVYINNATYLYTYKSERARHYNISFPYRIATDAAAAAEAAAATTEHSPQCRTFSGGQTSFFLFFLIHLNLYSQLTRIYRSLSLAETALDSYMLRIIGT